MPVALSQRDPFSYDKYTLTSGQATDSPGNRTFTLTKSIFLPELPETLEVLINGVKLKKKVVDEVVIHIWGETQLQTTYSINREGYLFIDHLGQLSVLGMTLLDAKKYLKHRCVE